MNKNKLLKSLIGLSLGYCLLLLLAGPLVLKPLLIKQSKNHLNGSLQLESLWINPLTHAISLENLSIINNENQILAVVERVYIDIDILPLILMQAHVKSFQVEQLKLIDNQESPDDWLKLDQLQLEKLNIGILKKTITAQAILLNSLSVKPTLHKNGKVNAEEFLTSVSNLLVSPTNKENDDDGNISDGNALRMSEEDNLVTENEDNNWLLTIHKLQLKNSKVILKNHRISSTETNEEGEKAAIIPISSIDIHVSSLSSDLSKDVTLSVSMELMKGEFKIDGQINPDKMTSNLNYNLTDIQLDQMNAYIEHFSLATLQSGLLNSSGTLITDKPKTNTIDKESGKAATMGMITINNETQLENLVVKHQKFDDFTLSCQLIDTGALNSIINPSSGLKQLTLESFIVDQCLFKIVLLKDGSSNLAFAKPLIDNKATTDKATQASSKKQETEKKQPLPIKIGKIQLSQHEIQLKDKTQMTAIETRISDLNLTINDIAEGSTDKTSIQLNAKINDHAPLSLEGTANFINPEISANTQLQLTRLGLASFSPYTLALSSRPIDKGVLSLNIKTQIQENKLDSANKVKIEGIKMGKRQALPESGNLPLALAVTVLRDSNGDLSIDIPVHGDLDDPGFSIRKQVFRSLTGIINKAAIAPFNMVGGLISTDNTQERIIPFGQLSSSLDEKAKKQAGKITETLQKNPELALHLTAVLGEAESKNMDTAQKTNLLSERIKAFEAVLLHTGLAPEQLEKNPVAIDHVKQQGGLEIRFFAR